MLVYSIWSLGTLGYTGSSSTHSHHFPFFLGTTTILASHSGYMIYWMMLVESSLLTFSLITLQNWGGKAFIFS